MSIKDRLAKKTEGLVKGMNQTAHDPMLNLGTGRDAKGPLTAPGQMLAFRTQMQESAIRIEELENRLKNFEGGAIVQKIDAKLIHPSKWANRHEYSFNSAKFGALKAEIEATGGNIQPILLRALKTPAQGYEVVYGHRRHRACLDLDYPVLAFVGDLSDKEMFAMMERENRHRDDLSPYEQGEMYRRALDDGIFPSLRQLAAELSVDVGLVSKALTIARLPQPVLSSFESPTMIQYRWGKELNAAIQRDPEGTLARAVAIQSAGKKGSAREILEFLVGKSKADNIVTNPIKCKGKTIGRMVRKPGGLVDITINAGILEPEKASKLLRHIEEFLLID